MSRWAPGVGPCCAYLGCAGARYLVNLLRESSPFTLAATALAFSRRLGAGADNLVRALRLARHSLRCGVHEMLRVCGSQHAVDLAPAHRVCGRSQCWLQPDATTEDKLLDTDEAPTPFCPTGLGMGRQYCPTRQLRPPANPRPELHEPNA
jgi:hypothetical protein